MKLKPIKNRAQVKDRTGETFGLLTVTRLAGSDGSCAHWECLCDCGNTTTVSVKSLRKGRTKSCGCIQKETLFQKGGNETHGMTKTSEYRIWRAMRARCSNPNRKGYEHYGGRGIKVCARWDTSFEEFLSDMGLRPSSKHTIDRIDNDGDYTPENCRWATRKEQAQNRRTNVVLSHSGTTATVSEWTEKRGFGRGTIDSRLRMGWPVSKALTEPMRPHKSRQK